MKSKIYLSIATVIFEITSEATLHIDADCAEFCSQEKPSPFSPEQPQLIQVQLNIVKVSSKIDGEIICQMPQCIVLRNENLERRILMGAINAYYREVDENKVIIEICQEDTETIIINTSLLEAFALERFLLKQNALVLHSSFIEWEGKGIAFTAPSGTGKSTQATLWQRHEGCEIINGDRSIIVQDITTQKYYIAGLPFCGSSNIHRNKIMPLKAIVFIEQAPQNIVEKMPGIKAVSKLFGETSINKWNKEAVMKSIGLIEAIAKNVPMVHLKCNMEHDAVLTLKHYLNSLPI